MALALVIALAASTQVAAAPDVHSLGQPELARPTHVGLDLTLDFERKVVKGVADLTLAYPKGAAAARHLDLDTRALAVSSVSADGGAMPITIEPPVPRRAQSMHHSQPARRPQVMR